MKRSWTALAVALISMLAVAGCNDYGNTFQANTGASVASLSPSNIGAGSPDFVLTINGTGFVKQTYVTWNGKKLTTTVTLDSTGTVVTSVTAMVTAALVAKPGTATVITQNPFSGAGNNGLSNPVTFIINAPPNPIPTLTSIAPASMAACASSCTSFTLDLQGTNFITSSTDPTQVSQVRWTAGATQTTLVTTGVTATDIKATVPGALISTAGTAMVTVFNPPVPQTTPPGGTPIPSGGGGGTSAAQAFTITAAGGALAHAASQTVAEETPSVSADGRYVAYSAAENGHTQVFVRDTCEGVAVSGCKAQTTLLSVSSDGSAANDDSSSPSISANGRYVAFSSAASNLVENGPAGHQIYLRDTCAGVQGSCAPSTQIVSIDSNGALTGTESFLPSISASGRFVAFLAVSQSHTPQQAGVAPGAQNGGYRQVFVRDTCVGASGCTPKTSRISMQPGDGTSTPANTAAKRAGPAIGASGESLALAGQAATFFTRSVAIDDRVFLAITKSNN